MTIRAILWTYAPKKDGTCSVKIYASEGRKKQYYNTNICVTPADWDEAKGEVRKSHPNYKLANAAIQRRLIELQAHFLSGGSWKTKKANTGGLIAFFEQYIKECETGVQPMAPGTVKNYRGTLTRLRAFLGGVELPWEEITPEWMVSFSRFLSDSCARAGIDKHMKQVKKMVNEAAVRGLHTVEGHKSWKIKKHTKNNKVYLTEAEMQAIEALDLSDRPALERERDRFVVSYRLLLAYADSVAIRQDKLFERDGQWYYRNIRQKTGVESIVPVKPVVMEILRKRNFDLAGDTNQEANRKLKQIAAMAGIDAETVEGSKKGPKWMFVATHTARRSAATNLALQNVALTTIAQVGGWDRVETLRLYLRASGVDMAESAAKLEFFR